MHRLRSIDYLVFIDYTDGTDRDLAALINWLSCKQELRSRQLAYVAHISLSYDFCGYDLRFGDGY